MGITTGLEAPHRLAEAILRDSVLDRIKFRDHDAAEPPISR
jgi:hypothetical protein